MSDDVEKTIHKKPDRRTTPDQETRIERGTGEAGEGTVSPRQPGEEEGELGPPKFARGLGLDKLIQDIILALHGTRTGTAAIFNGLVELMGDAPRYWRCNRQTRKGWVQPSCVSGRAPPLFDFRSPDAIV